MKTNYSPQKLRDAANWVETSCTLTLLGLAFIGICIGTAVGIGFAARQGGGGAVILIVAVVGAAIGVVVGLLVTAPLRLFAQIARCLAQSEEHLAFVRLNTHAAIQEPEPAAG